MNKKAKLPQKKSKYCELCDRSDYVTSELDRVEADNFCPKLNMTLCDMHYNEKGNHTEYSY